MLMTILQLLASVTASPSSGVCRFIFEDALALLLKDFPSRHFVRVTFDEYGVNATFYGKKFEHSQLDHLDPSQVTFLLLVGNHYQVLSVKHGVQLCQILVEEHDTAHITCDPPASYTVVVPEFLLRPARGNCREGGCSVDKVSYPECESNCMFWRSVYNVSIHTVYVIVMVLGLQGLE